MIINKITKNEKIFLATPIIIAKYFPKYLKTLKNNANFKSNIKLDNEINSLGGGDPSINHNIEVIIGNKYAPRSI